MRYLTAADTQMLYSDTPHAQNTIAPVAIYDPSSRPGGELRYDDLLRYVEDRLHVSPTFRERLVRMPFALDRPLWVRDPDFDLEYHVRELSLPRPGDWKQLCTQIQRLGARPIDLTRPPWELYLIQGLDAIEGVPPGSFATMLRLHHAAVDGVAGVQLVSALLQDDPAQEPPPPTEAWTPESPPSVHRLLLNAAVHSVITPVRQYRQLLTAVGVTPQTLRQLVRPLPGTARLTPMGSTRFNRPVSAHRVWGAVRFDIADVKRVKGAVAGTTVNDVAMAIVGGGLRRYLDAHAELPESSLTTIMPISVRPTSTQRTDAKQVRADDGGNKFAMAMVELGTDIADPVERLRKISENTRSGKEFGESALALVEASQALPGALVGTAQRAVMRLVNATGRTIGAHTIVTNVPGPRTALYFAGAPCVFMSGMAPVVDGMGLINAVSSYQKDFTIAWTADRDQMPDPDTYAEALTQEFKDLDAAV